jgi:hypothetical protein
MITLYESSRKTLSYLTPFPDRTGYPLIPVPTTKGVAKLALAIRAHI